jgi:DNA gyrase subunit A
MKLTPKTGLIVAAGMVRDEDTVMMMNTKGTIIRIPANQINKLGRTTQGVTLMRFAEDEQVATMTIARAKDGDASMNGVDPAMILQGDA